MESNSVVLLHGRSNLHRIMPIHVLNTTGTQELLLHRSHALSGAVRPTSDAQQGDCIVRVHVRRESMLQSAL